MEKIEIYDTTLRDGAQAEDVKFSPFDKMRIMERLDRFGVDFIEGGWPGGNPRADDFFELAKKYHFQNSTLVAFGATHHKNNTAANDKSLRALLVAGTAVIAIVGKTDEFHVINALEVSLEENLRLIKKTILHLIKNGKRVFFDAEHFFDGYKRNRQYALDCLKVAAAAGAERLILCDTNGGTLPDQISSIVAEVKISLPEVKFGIHAHNDIECAVASTLAAVKLGVIQIQGTINGIGERCGNANLISIMPALKFKLGLNLSLRLNELKELSGLVNELANLRHFKRQPWVGDSAFAHKGGIHASAVLKNPQTYEHVSPELVGNSRKILMSDLAGRANLLRKAEDFGIDLNKESAELPIILKRVKELERLGYDFEAADASLELLIRRQLKLHGENIFFEILTFKVIVEKGTKPDGPVSQASVRLRVGDSIKHEVAESKNGPVNALDKVLRQALEKFYPALKQVRLTD